MCILRHLAIFIGLAWLSTDSVSSLKDVKTGKHGTFSPRDAIACSPDTQPRVMTEPTGTFTSQNYPLNYPDNAYCTWLIVAQPGQIVSLDFDDFDTQRGFDRVWIYDGNSESSPVLIGLDGTRSPPPNRLFSSQENLFVVFSSDASTNAVGFSATYASVDPSGIEDACAPLFRPLIVKSYSGLLTSLYFPSPYPFGLNCQWIIESQEASGFVQLDFTNFLTQPNADWVTIYDGDSDAAPLIARLSGAYTTPPIGFLTTQGSMFVQFTSDLATSVRGFNATFTSVPPA
jgi:hypothetical protein